MHLEIVYTPIRNWNTHFHALRERICCFLKSILISKHNYDVFSCYRLSLHWQIVTALYRSVSHKDCCSESQSSVLCLVKSSNSAFAPCLMTSQAGGHLTSSSYSSKLPFQDCPVTAAGPRYIALARTAQKTYFPTVTPWLLVTQPLPRNDCSSGLSKHGTIFIYD
jgi:hypothetical protein